MADKEFKVLSVAKREGLGKGNNRRLRAKGLVPGVFYASDGTNTAVQADMKSLEKVYSEVGRTTVFQLDISGEQRPALFWDIKRDPCKNTFSHIDFYGVDLERAVKVIVPVIFEGTPKGTKVGGVMETFRECVTLSAKPLDMPSRITVDVSDIDMNQSITVADLKLPEGVVAVYENNYTLVSVHLPEEDATDAAAPAAAAAAPAAAPAAKK